MAILKLVPNDTSSATEKHQHRIRKLARPDGVLQCKRCGGRTTMTAKSDVLIRDGRKLGGTLVEKDVCADCYRQGIYSPMMVLPQGVD